MAEAAILRKASKDAVVVALITRDKAMSPGELEPGLIVSEGGGEPGKLGMTGGASGSERAHVRIFVASATLGSTQANGGFWTVTGNALHGVMNTPQGELPKIVVSGAWFKTLSVVASIASCSKNPSVDIFVTV